METYAENGEWEIEFTQIKRDVWSSDSHPNDLFPEVKYRQFKNHVFSVDFSMHHSNIISCPYLALLAPVVCTDCLIVCPSVKYFLKTFSTSPQPSDRFQPNFT